MLSLNTQRWSHATPMLLFCTVIYCCGDLIFGLDTGSFGSIQALPSFINKFGTKGANGKYALSTSRKSLMNSLVWIGKGAGTILFEPILERTGYRWAMYGICVVQCIGIIIELTANNWAVFTVGRIFAYLATGLVENAVPSYTSELAPAPLRGFLSGSLVFIVTIGNLWGAGIARQYDTVTTNKGWMIPTSMQLIPPVILFIALPFTPESPRWLVSHGHNDRALSALERVRPQREIDAGMCSVEVSVLEEAIEQANLTGTGSWLDLFRGKYLRRTLIVSIIFIFQEITGQQFYNSYGPTFYQQVGLGNKAFDYQVLSLGMVILGVFITMLVLDTVGRRIVLIVGCFMQTLFMLLVAGLGTKKHKSQSDIHGFVASLIIFYVWEKVSLSVCAFLIGSEIGGVKMRKKMMTFGTTWDVIGAFVVTFSVPYLLSTPGANLGPKVAWIFAGTSALSFIFVTLCVPELKGRSLEEVDELFDMKLWAWQFSSAKTMGIGRRIAELEEGHAEATMDTKQPQPEQEGPEAAEKV